MRSYGAVFDFMVPFAPTATQKTITGGFYVPAPKNLGSGEATDRADAAEIEKRVLVSRTEMSYIFE